MNAMARTYDDWKTRDDTFDHEEPPQQWFTCDACDGSGEIVTGYWGYEPGCGHGHMMDHGEPCGKCNGEGGWIDDVEHDQ
jgi:hypothetical protein